MALLTQETLLTQQTLLTLNSRDSNGSMSEMLSHHLDKSNSQDRESVARGQKYITCLCLLSLMKPQTSGLKIQNVTNMQPPYDMSKIATATDSNFG